MAFIVDGNLLILSVFVNLWACLNSFSALLFSFSNLRSFFVILDCRLSSRSSCCISSISFRAILSCWRCSHVFVCPLNDVLISDEALFWFRFFHALPETFRPLITVFDSSFVDASDMIAVEGLFWYFFRLMIIFTGVRKWIQPDGRTDSNSWLDQSVVPKIYLTKSDATASYSIVPSKNCQSVIPRDYYNIHTPVPPLNAYGLFSTLRFFLMFTLLVVAVS